eukprot:CAMPEP_0194361466 /NCGR_PEP_ID=MMETSP0174-20130528/9051_1 /TAXON_ID=216777 /ORGANISM="Proboscia alata, Strain PI-D3" /LENGTH=1292 /DNA_ID=CAMNT_0039133693 /DNA_START=376 /DNA_END=4254 /DNA_ORIENTATION=-
MINHRMSIHPLRNPKIIILGLCFNIITTGLLVVYLQDNWQNSFPLVPQQQLLPKIRKPQPIAHPLPDNEMISIPVPYPLPSIKQEAIIVPLHPLENHKPTKKSENEVTSMSQTFTKVKQQVEGPKPLNNSLPSTKLETKPRRHVEALHPLPDNEMISIPVSYQNTENEVSFMSQTFTKVGQQIKDPHPSNNSVQSTKIETEPRRHEEAFQNDKQTMVAPSQPIDSYKPKIIIDNKMISIPQTFTKVKQEIKDPHPLNNNFYQLKNSYGVDVTTPELQSQSGMKRMTGTVNMTNAAILIITCNRSASLNKALASLFRTEQTILLKNIDVIVSWDRGPKCLENHEEMSNVFSKYSDFISTVWKKPVHEPLHVPWSKLKANSTADENEPVTRLVARHYKWALDRVFQDYGFAIICEDDLEYSSDFLPYMLEVGYAMKSDPSIFCVSAWNDNGKSLFATDPSRLYRTDVFPGLGWGTSKTVWESIQDDFPHDHWDWWMRLDTTTRRRDCIFPEISRTRHLGTSGGATVSSAVVSQFLKGVVYNERFMDFHLDYNSNVIEIDPWLSKEEYKNSVVQIANNALHFPYDSQAGQYIIKHVESAETHPLVGNLEGHNAILISYDIHDYENIANLLKVIKSRRCSWEGITVFHMDVNIFEFEYLLLADEQEVRYLSKLYKGPFYGFNEVITQEKDVTCDYACNKLGMVCVENQFVYLNNCNAMKRNFNCKGCIGGVKGDEIPAYGTAKEKPQFYEQCIVSSPTASKCNARHWSTQRLCPCIESLKIANVTTSFSSTDASNKTRSDVAVIIIACSEKALMLSLKSLLKANYDAEASSILTSSIDIIISWDKQCSDPSSNNGLFSGFEKFIDKIHELWIKPISEPPHMQWATLISKARDMGERNANEPIARILARHYQWTLTKAFALYEHVIIVEDNLDYRPTFLPFMLDGKNAIENDDSIFCVGGWNELESSTFVHNASRVYRTDIFPGKAWLTSKTVWESIRHDFPTSEWEQWMRFNTTMKGRDCIVPEMSHLTIGDEASKRFLQITPGLSVVLGEHDTGSLPFNRLERHEYQQQIEAMVDKALVIPFGGPSLGDVKVMLHHIVTSGTISYKIPLDDYDCVVVLYELRDYESLARELRISTKQRRSWNGLTVLYLPSNCQFNTLILADTNQVRLFPKLYNAPFVGLQPIVSGTDQSCDYACAQHSLQCVQDQFVHIDNCDTMMRHFNCTSCWLGVNGPDIPVLVVSEEKPSLFGLCLLAYPSKELPTCEAHNWASKRLCPCANTDKGGKGFGWLDLLPSFS